jgi:catechol 2,3-dioxygenase-like lactoylglutathione lyase family enzyme
MSAHFAAIGLVVADMAASIDFYRTLGLDLPDDVTGQPHVEAALPGGLRLMFDVVETARSIDPNWTAPTGGPGAALAFECDSPADVDAVYEAVTAAGTVGHVPPWDAVWGQRYAVVHDPDGNGVDLFATL